MPPLGPGTSRKKISSEHDPVAKKKKIASSAAPLFEMTTPSVKGAASLLGAAVAAAAAAAAGVTASGAALAAGATAVLLASVIQTRQSRIDAYCSASLGHTNKPEWAIPNLEEQTIEHLTEAMRRAGLESIGNLFIAVDMTMSNIDHGVGSFENKNMHDLDPDIDNPYQAVMRATVECLGRLNASGTTHLLKFGCLETRHLSTRLVGKYSSIESLMNGYSKMVRGSSMASPTSFAAVVRDAAKMCRDNGSLFSVCVIVADGQVHTAEGCWEATKQEFVNAADGAPLAVVIAGVGKGPWDQMEHLDDELPRRKFDNVQFMKTAPFQEELERQGGEAWDEAVKAAFTLCMCQELPAQYRACDELGLIGALASGDGSRDAKRPRIEC